MKIKLTIAAASLAVLSIGITVYTQVQKNAATGQGWEYAEIQLSQTESSLPKLNAAGAQGWELINVISACRDKGAGTYKDWSCEYWAYMKRRK